MSAELFDLEVAETCPREYQNMQSANSRFRDLFVKLCDADPSVTEDVVSIARVEAQTAERAARVAYNDATGYKFSTEPKYH